MNVEIRNSEIAKGKGLFALKQIKKGDIIFEENPLVCCQFSWNKAYKYKACDHCLRPLETAQENACRLTGDPYLSLPYSECCTTDKSTIVTCPMCAEEYCSPSCKQIAFQQYHQTICPMSTDKSGTHPLEQLDEAWKHMHYPPETNSIFLIVRLLARIIQSPDPDKAISDSLQFCHTAVDENSELSHKLLGDQFTDKINLLMDLMKVHFSQDVVQPFFTVDGFTTLLALIGRNGQGVGTSAISQWVTKTSELDLPQNDKNGLDEFIKKLYDKLEEQSGSFLNNEGVALYHYQSACNHSCVPNAECAFLHNSSKLSLVALKDINIGDEIFISYLDPCFLERSRHSRRKYLQENYVFLCNCEKCQFQMNEDDVTSEDDFSDSDEDEDM